jgi:hypothetical protein
MAWWLRLWNVVEKVVDSNFIWSIHHLKNLEFGDSMACRTSTDPSTNNVTQILLFF